LWRVAGALIGAIIAVLLMLIFNERGWHTVVAMLAGVSIMSLISLRKPDLSYGLVTVTIITVAPDFQLVEGAFSKVLAIAIGSCSAILACLLVLPVSADRSADAKVADAIRLCAHAIADCLNCTTDDQAGKSHEAEYEVSRRLREAWLVWQQASMEKVPRPLLYRRRSRCTRSFLTHAQRLQENLALAERISDRPLNGPMSEQHKAQLTELGEAIERQLNEVSVALTQREACIDTTDLWEQYRQFAEEADYSARNTDDPAEREHLLALKWVCNVILTNVEALKRELQPDDEEACEPNNA